MFVQDVVDDDGSILDEESVADEFGLEDLDYSVPAIQVDVERVAAEIPAVRWMLTRQGEK
jgi:hypothetical protein